MSDDWCDDDGDPLGEWVEIQEDEMRSIVKGAGGLAALSVFSTLTDPEGIYGAPQVYTAWGRPKDRVPLVDIRDRRGDDDDRVTYRKFVER